MGVFKLEADLIGINNENEYFSNHFFSTLLADSTKSQIDRWNKRAKEEAEETPWAKLRQVARPYFALREADTAAEDAVGSDDAIETKQNEVSWRRLADVCDMGRRYLSALGYGKPRPEWIELEDGVNVPVLSEITNSSGVPLAWIVAAAQSVEDTVLQSRAFFTPDVPEDAKGTVSADSLTQLTNEALVEKIFFNQSRPPRHIVFMGMNQIVLVDRTRWDRKCYLEFDLDEVFTRRETSTLQIMSALLHAETLCPSAGQSLMEELDDANARNAAGVSQDLKYAIRKSVELLGNEVLYYLRVQGQDCESDPNFAQDLTLECVRFMYRMLFVLFLEARPELGFAPTKNPVYEGYSLEGLRDITDSARADTMEIGEGFYLHETVITLFDLMYNGYREELVNEESIHGIFSIPSLKAHIFDPERTPILRNAKIRNQVMLQIIDLMSTTRPSSKKSSRRGRISYANLGINQLGAVYEALLSYRGFIAPEDLYEVKKATDSADELQVGYFVPMHKLEEYDEKTERVREPNGEPRMYPKGTFVYRMAGREREKSASYYTPESLTKTLVKYALRELLEGKSADEILSLKVCEPAMGSAAFLNEAVNQLAEAYLTRKEAELGSKHAISSDDRSRKLQEVKMYIADKNVYGIDLNPVAVELAEVSLWLNTIHEKARVPWFGTQLLTGNSLIGARHACYDAQDLRKKRGGGGGNKLL